MSIVRKEGKTKLIVEHFMFLLIFFYSSSKNGYIDRPHRLAFDDNKKFIHSIN